jgi:hypothetical protein
MQKKKIRQWPFTKKATNSNTSTPSMLMPVDTVPSSGKWYQNITELPLRNYIDCVVDGNYCALVVSGNPTEHELLLAWAQIQQEYADIMADSEHRLYVTLYRDIKVLELTLKLIHFLIEELKKVYYDEYTNRLNDLLKTNFQFDYTEPVKYLAELNRCTNRSKGIKIDLALKMGKFEAIQKKNTEKGSKPTREYFQSILITLSDHAKYQVMDTVTVYEYSERMRRFSKYCEQVESLKNAR